LLNGASKILISKRYYIDIVFVFFFFGGAGLELSGVRPELFPRFSAGKFYPLEMGNFFHRCSNHLPVEMVCAK